jgi:RNA polymerase sigma factor (sigma-70 family)
MMADRLLLSHHAITENFTRLRKLLERRYGEGDDQVDDIAQAVFTNLAGMDDARFVKIRNVWAYIVKMANNCECDQRRKPANRSDHVEWTDEVEESELNPPKDSLTETDPGLVDHYLKKALDALPPARAAIINSHLMDGYSFEEIAAALGCPVDTVRRYYDDSIALIYENSL